MSLKLGNTNIAGRLETDIEVDTNAPIISISSETLTVTDTEGNLMAVTVNGKTITPSGSNYGTVKTGDKVKAYDRAGNVSSTTI